MSLGKLLRRTEIKRDTGRVFITDVIDREISKSRPSFNWKQVFATVKALNRLLVGTFDRDAYWKLFQDLTDFTYAPPIRHDRIFHPSSLAGDCPRKLHYEMGMVEFSDAGTRRIGAQLQRTFDVGTWWHTYIQNWLHRAGVLVEAEVHAKCDKRKIDGRGDGVICFVPGFPKEAKRYLLEIKSINSRGYLNIKSAPYDYHVHQASIYADVLGLDEIFFLYINKDTGEMCEHLVPVDVKQLAIAYAKIDEVLLSVKTGEAPERVCGSRAAKQALECGFCNHCFTQPA